MTHWWYYFRHHQDPPITIYNIVEGIQHKLKDFRNILVSQVRRQGNHHAYILPLRVDFVAWTEKNLIIIESTLTQDVLFLSSS